MSETASKVDVGTHLSEQEVVTDALLKNEANTQEIERVNFGSNKICIREDQAKDKMVFSEKSSRAIFEMGNVELIELKKSSIQCPSCLHHVFEGTFIRMYGKWIPIKDVMIPIKEAFEAQKAQYCHTSSIVTRGSRCGPNPWQQHHHEARDALRSATKGERTFTSIWTDGNMMKSTGNLSSHTIGRTIGSGIWITSRCSTQATMHRNGQERGL